MTAERIQVIHIVLCYAREDEKLLEKLKAHLVELQRQKLINVWYDREIVAGTEWQQEIFVHLNTADIILLLISPDFMASEHCYSEMERAIERHISEDTCVVPILLRSGDYERTPISKLDLLPADKKPITS